MERAFELAREALEVGEVPVGCVLHLPGKLQQLYMLFLHICFNPFSYIGHGIIGEGRNRVNETKNATRHAEVEAIDEALMWINDNLQGANSSEIFAETEVWVNVEPCIQCASALQISGFRKVYFGCSNERFGGCGSVLDVSSKDQRFPSLQLSGGLRREEAVSLLKQFYCCENPNAPNPKSKEGRRVL